MIPLTRRVSSGTRFIFSPFKQIQDELGPINAVQ
jgi:hypothetical protein